MLMWNNPLVTPPIKVYGNPCAIMEIPYPLATDNTIDVKIKIDGSGNRFPWNSEA